MKLESRRDHYRKLARMHESESSPVKARYYWDLAEADTFEIEARILLDRAKTLRADAKADLALIYHD